MKLAIFTIALDAMPFITCHLPVLNQLDLDWHWTIAEGVAANVLDTAWCAPIPPRLSRDGTTEYLNSIRSHPRVTVIQRQLWNGKVAQCNACLDTIKEPCVLMQVDSDELWTASGITAVFNSLSAVHTHPAVRFKCVYFVGPHLIITSDNTYGNRHGEWVRAWRFSPNQRFEKHEPPVLHGAVMTERAPGVGFFHYAYVTESQVRFKQLYYGYEDAAKHWWRLQAHDKFPAKLADFFPWVKDEAIVDRLYPK